MATKTDANARAEATSAYPHYAAHCARLQQRTLPRAAFESVFDATASAEGVTASFDTLDASDLA